ncbi:hypothetical protein K440DRAFT_629870 [Wilcoxina mikolae CBS 423.85]|nr:hypothetical protein K440DRAFT_629870 [Wilcoxina mikolae CBS 423.85]
MDELSVPICEVNFLSGYVLQLQLFIQTPNPRRLRLPMAGPFLDRLSKMRSVGTRIWKTISGVQGFLNQRGDVFDEADLKTISEHSLLYSMGSPQTTVRVRLTAFKSRTKSLPISSSISEYG